MTAQAPDELKRLCLHKVVESRTFARSQQLRHLLEWLGERAIEGSAPSEYDVGVHTLGRPGNFDPQTDSLVRKEMTRMRVKLRSYYAEEGRNDTVRIVSANGYRLKFELSATNAGLNDASSKCLLVLPLRGANVKAEFLELFHHELLIRLSESDNIQIIAQTTARFYSARSGDVRTFAAETGADFVVEGTALGVNEDMVAATVWLVDGRTGRAKRLCSLRGIDAEELGDRAASYLLECLSVGPLSSGCSMQMPA